MFVTRFGDSAVLLPLTIVFSLTLWRYESSRTARQFALATLCCIAALLSLKLLFLSYGHTWYERLESPSGHAGLSVMVYGAMALVLADHLSLRGSQVWYFLAGAGGIVLVLAIAVSRKQLGAHSAAEVALGCMVGIACLGMFWRNWRRAPRRPMPLLPVYCSLAVLAVTMSAVSFSPEKQIMRAAARIKAQIRDINLNRELNRGTPPHRPPPGAFWAGPSEAPILMFHGRAWPFAVYFSGPYGPYLM